MNVKVWHYIVLGFFVVVGAILWAVIGPTVGLIFSTVGVAGVVSHALSTTPAEQSAVNSAEQSAVTSAVHSATGVSATNAGSVAGATPVGDQQIVDATIAEAERLSASNAGAVQGPGGNGGQSGG